MTDKADIVNLALQIIGTRSDVDAAELAAESSNEAKEANKLYDKVRQRLLRMAPWDCAMNTNNLVYISSLPGTPENQSPATALWEKGQPPPPWVYEYQYPEDCLRACWVVPQTQTGYAGAVPITNAVTGGAVATWLGQPIKFKVQVDQFYPVTAAAVVAGGSGYAIGDVITLPYGATTSPPIGAPVKLQVATVAAGAILTVSVVNQIFGSSTPQGGSYFAAQSGTIAQDETTGSGTGATFTLTFGSQGSQRVIVTNQEFATLSYIKEITDPNVMDPMFQDAWVNVLAAGMVMALSGDKDLANGCIKLANELIERARTVDGNEGLTVNDVTPDWIRIRGITSFSAYGTPFSQFNWGSSWPAY